MIHLFGYAEAIEPKEAVIGLLFLVVFINLLNLEISIVKIEHNPKDRDILKII